MKEHEMTLEVPPEATEWLAETGYDPLYGARPLRRAVHRHVLNPLARLILAGGVRKGEKVTLRVAGDKLMIPPNHDVDLARARPAWDDGSDDGEGAFK